MTVLAVSPHLDDAAFSAGGLLATLAREHAVVVATVFTQSVPGPTGFALRCQTDKGVSPGTDYMELRRAEEAEACSRLRAYPVWMGLPEAPHRGYESAEALFAGVLPSDAEMWRQVLHELRRVAAHQEPDVVLTCQGLGQHVDHRHVVRAVATWAAEEGVPALWWRDLPYAIREPDALPAPAVPDGLLSASFPLDADALQAKLDACAQYRTQLPYQFGRDTDEAPEAAMRARLQAFARQEHGAGGYAERFAVAAQPSPPLASLLRLD